VPYLRTERLTIVPFTLALNHAALADRDLFATLLGAAVPAEWPGPDFAEILPGRVEKLVTAPNDAEWSGLIIHTIDRVLIGDMGFHTAGPDEDGEVELGYAINPAYRRQGYAFEATKALMRWGLAQPGVRRIVAHCLADNLGSVGVLTKLGMRQVDRLLLNEGELLQWQTR
jgi:[ribosomal protein S5]-alanine N-acetyltransferase